MWHSHLRETVLKNFLKKNVIIIVVAAVVIALVTAVSVSVSSNNTDGTSKVANFIMRPVKSAAASMVSSLAVSYTHLDVYKRQGVARAEQVFLINGARLHGWNNVFIHILVGQIFYIQFGCAGFESLFFQAFQLVGLADVSGDGNHFAVVVIFLQPRNDDGRCV